MGRFFKIIGIYILSLAIIALLYYLLGLIPGYMDTQELNASVRLVLYVFVPIGYALYTFPADGYATDFEKFVSFIGFLIMFISTLLLHIALMQTKHAAVGHLTIMPLVWIYINITYHNIGNEDHEGWDAFKINMEGLAMLLVCMLIFAWLNTSVFGDEKGICFIVVAAISMVHLGISRIKNGSAFN